MDGTKRRHYKEDIKHEAKKRRPLKGDIKMRHQHETIKGDLKKDTRKGDTKRRH